MNRLLLPLLIAVALLGACRREPPAPAADPDAPPAQPQVPAEPPGDDADAARPEHPRLRVTTLDGAAYDLADHRGKWVIVNFWATWCAPCRKEMPELSALGAMREHIEVIGLAYEEIEPEAMRAFLEERPVLYPIAIVDPYAPPEDFETPRGLPLTYLIDPQGRVAQRYLGPVTAERIERDIAAAGGPPVPEAGA
ncbi:TlpA family protein disulfide reductase [Luteimonas huabeiensis]|uniref:TlpA family protein disulfide reductase n=1 Tax=Luteimonas huabeiensis TaxID=1244513 RepID=UPI000466E2D5|nr:TlpA disulfide reductase family protein [Luteimonas huabeiensis]